MVFVGLHRARSVNMGRISLAWLIVTAVVCPASRAAASPPVAKVRPPDPVALLAPSNSDALSGALRGYLAHHMSPTLYEAAPDWGHTTRVANGLKWTGKQLPLHPHIHYSEKNDGDWRKVVVSTTNLPDTLVLEIRNIQQPGLDRVTFDIFLAFDAHVDYEHQRWESGIRLYAAGAKARLRIKAHLSCEASARLEPSGKLLPDAVIQLHVAKADVTYDNLVVEHVAGVGGEAAKLIGDSLVGGMRQWRPSLEKELLAKADAAVVKAGDTREVRIRLAQLFDVKKRPAVKDSATPR
jgi:hypothetical protein